MALIGIDKQADFSARGLGRILIRGTGVTRGLQAFHDLRSDATTARRNLAGGLGATAPGATFTAQTMEVDATGDWVSGYAPASGASTFAVVAKLKLNGGQNDYPLGSVGTPATQGAAYFAAGESTFRFEATTSSSPTAISGLAGLVSGYPVASGEAGRFELFVAVLDPAAGLRLYRPKVGGVMTSPLGSGRYFTFVGAPNVRALAGDGSAQHLALYAHWSVALSDQEVAAFYSEQKSRLSAIGLVI